MAVNCPKCYRPPGARSITLIEGHAVLICRKCRLFAIEGVDVWIDGGSDVMARLRNLGGVATEKAKEYMDQMNEMINSDDDDVRWTRI